MSAFEASKAQKIDKGASKVSFSVVNPHELSHLFCIRPLSGDVAPGQDDVLVATTHATVFENDGLVTKIVANHIGGVVRFSVDANGALSVSEGVGSGLFLGQPVPRLFSADNTREFIHSLLVKQGVLGL